MNDGPGTGTRTLMRIVAAGVDAFQFFINIIPLVGAIVCPVISVAALIVFWLWFKSHNISIFSGKIAKGTFIAVALELMPFGDAFAPGFFGLVQNALSKSAQPEDTV